MQAKLKQNDLTMPSNTRAYVAWYLSHLFALDNNVQQKEVRLADKCLSAKDERNTKS